MNLFLLLLFPLGFIIWARLHSMENLPKFLLIAFFGIFPSALFCLYKFFFSPFYYLLEDSFFKNYIYLLLSQAVIPVVVLVVAFLLIDRDPLSERFANLYPFLAGFYGVFIPFRVLCENRPYPAFMLFEKPIIYFFMVLALSKCLKVIFAKGKVSALNIIKRCFMPIAVVLLLAVPAAIEAYWLIGGAETLALASTAVYAVFCALLLLVP